MFINSEILIRCNFYHIEKLHLEWWANLSCIRADRNNSLRVSKRLPHETEDGGPQIPCFRRLVALSSNLQQMG